MIDIRTLEVIGGSLPRRALNLTIEWAIEHREELMVAFMDGTNGIVDFSSVLTAKECGIFEALKDKACFDQARLDLGVVTWPGGADIDPAWSPRSFLSTAIP